MTVFRWDSDVESAHGTRGDGARGTAVQAGAQEADGRPDEKTAQKGCPWRERSAIQLLAKTMLDLFTIPCY